MSEFTISVKELCEECFKIHSEHKNFLSVTIIVNKLLLKVCEKVNINIKSKELNKDELLKFVKKFSKCWKEARRSKTVFLKKYENSNWYKNSLKLIKKVIESVTECDVIKIANSTNNSRGRPKKKYFQSSKSTKRRKIDSISKEISLHETYEVLKHDLRMQKEYDKVSVVDLLQNSDPDVITRLKESVSKPAVSCDEFNTSQALALYMDLDLSARQYKILRSTMIKKNYRGLPSYEKLMEEKKDCVPNDILVDDVSAKISLQSSLDHMAKRIIETLDFEQKDTCYSYNMVLYSKWGCDGSSGQAVYKQIIG